MKYFDSHAHYLAKRFKKDMHKLLVDMHKNDGVEYIVNSTSDSALESGLQLAKKYDFFYLSITMDDFYLDDLEEPEKEESKINELLERTVAKALKLKKESGKIVGWGEFGMDFRKEEPTEKSIKNQSFWFKKDLEAARQLKLPVVIHSGNACDMVFDLLKAANMPDYGNGKGMIHSFLGSPELAQRYIKMGYLISVTGVVTHRSPRGRNLAQVVKKVPLENMVIETDAPHLTPEPFRDRRNDSSYLKLVVEEIAKIKNVSPQEVAKITTSNAKALFGIR